MNFKKTIDTLKGVSYPNKIDPEIISRDIEAIVDPEEFANMKGTLESMHVQNPLQTTKLWQPINYAFQARAAFEVLSIANRTEADIINKYNLHEAGQSGIGLDWQQLQNDGLWVPAFYNESIGINKSTRAILSRDERNCYSVWKLKKEIADDQKFLEFDEEIITLTSAEKIQKLTQEAAWRTLAIEYTQRLITHILPKYKHNIVPGFEPIIDSMISTYSEEMNIVSE